MTGEEDVDYDLARRVAERLLDDTPSWMQEALCVESDVNFLNPSTYNKAEQICASCPVREDCEEMSYSVPRAAGVWGGRTISKDER